MTGIELDGLAVGYRGGRRRRRVVLDGLSAQARPAELTALIGPNGVGKSTLLRTVAGLQPALAGAIRVAGADLTGVSPAQRARMLAVVLTDRVEPGLLSVRDLAGLGRHPHTGPGGRLGPAGRAAVDEALAAVGATHLADRPVAELSDGERQRVLTARALAQDPAVLLLDEPTAYLDVRGRVELLDLLRRLARERGLCVLVSTHDLELTLRLADHVWLVDRAGALHAGPPEQLIADGVVGTVFASGTVGFDPVSGGFVPRPAGSPSIRVHGEAPIASLVVRLLTRAGWRAQPAADADPAAAVELDAGPSGFRIRHAGDEVVLTGWAELARWARDGTT